MRVKMAHKQYHHQQHLCQNMVGQRAANRKRTTGKSRWIAKWRKS